MELEIRIEGGGPQLGLTDGRHEGWQLAGVRASRTWPYVHGRNGTLKRSYPPAPLLLRMSVDEEPDDGSCGGRPFLPALAAFHTRTAYASAGARGLPELLSKGLFFGGGRLKTRLAQCPQRRT
jgi:hypothetical protein